MIDLQPDLIGEGLGSLPRLVSDSLVIQKCLAGVWTSISINDHPGIQIQSRSVYVWGICGFNTFLASLSIHGALSMQLCMAACLGLFAILSRNWHVSREFLVISGHLISLWLAAAWKSDTVKCFRDEIKQRLSPGTPTSSWCLAKKRSETTSKRQNSLTDYLL